MEENFKTEIISPEKVVFAGDALMVTIPSYEGDMSILKNHISIITFLKPGIISIKNSKNNTDNFFVQDGTVEFFENQLNILSASAINVKDLSSEFLENTRKEAENKLSQQNISDKEHYILSHKLDIIKTIRT